MFRGRNILALVLSAAILVPSHWCCAFGVSERPCCRRSDSPRHTKRQSCCAAAADRTASSPNAGRFSVSPTEPGRKPIAACCEAKPPALSNRVIRYGSVFPQLSLFADACSPAIVVVECCELSIGASPPRVRGKLQPQLCCWRC